jgi:hypothetical protein
MAALVTELAVQTTDDVHDGPSLLLQLRRAVWGDTGGTVAGAGGNGLPVNMGAHILWCELGDEIEGAYSGVTGRRGSRSTVGNLLGWWATFGMLTGQGRITELMMDVALDRLRGWVQRVRDQFDAPFQVPLRGLNCPHCGRDRAEWMDRDLLISGAAIVVTLDDDLQLVAGCRNRVCTDVEGHRSRWVGDQEVLYMARRSGIDVDALASEIRAARAPQPDSYVEPDSRRIVDFDPDDAEHVALLGGEAS